MRGFRRESSMSHCDSYAMNCRGNTALCPPLERGEAAGVHLERGKAYFYPSLIRMSKPAMGLVLILAGAALAQPARVRELSYDPKSKVWVEEVPPPPKTPEGDLYQIRLLIRDENYRGALSAVTRFVKTHGAGDSLYPEVLLAKAESLIGVKNFDKAHATLQAFLNEFGGMALTDEALRLEFEVAEAYLSGVKKKVWGIFPVSGVDEGYKILDEISSDHTDSRLAELAIKTKADHMFMSGEHALSEIDYSRILRDHPQSRYHQYALGRSAEAALASFAGVEYDEAALIEAEERYNDYRSRYRVAADGEGVSAILTSLRESRAEKGFSIAQYYERTNHPGSAIFYYRSLRTQWPDTIAASKATERLELLGVLEPVASAANP